MCQSAVFSPLVSGESFTLCGAQLPRSGSAKNLPPGQGILLTQLVCPGQSVQRKDGCLNGLMTVFE